MVRKQLSVQRIGPECPSWVIRVDFGMPAACPVWEGGLNRSTQHFILKGKDGV